MFFIFICFFVFVCVCNTNMHISTEGHLQWAFGNDMLSEVDLRVDHCELQLSTGTGC
jgi:hypothetical protein